MKNNIENESKGYQDLLDDISKEENIHHSKIKYMVVGLKAAKKMTEKEYFVFTERTIYHSRFIDICLNMGISESACKTYYQRGLEKLKQTYQEVKLLKR